MNAKLDPHGPGAARHTGGHRRRRRTAWPLVATLAAALMVAACSGGGGSAAARGGAAGRTGTRGAAQDKRVELATSAAPSPSRNSAVTCTWPTKPSDGMTETPEISVAGTRHSLATRLPDVSRAPGGSPLTATKAAGGGAPT